MTRPPARNVTSACRGLLSVGLVRMSDDYPAHVERLLCQKSLDRIAVAANFRFPPFWL